MVTMTNIRTLGDAMANQTDSDVNELLARIAKLEALLAQRPHADTSRADIWFLLDRSGSMGAIAEYVVQSFDEFVAEQRNEAGEALMTLVQFDGEDPQDVLIDAQPLAGIGSIAGRFAPRGMTPLYEAIGMLLDRAEAHVNQVCADSADQLVVIMTDGHENASRRWTAAAIFERIAALRAAGWTLSFWAPTRTATPRGHRWASSRGTRPTSPRRPRACWLPDAG